MAQKHEHSITDVREHSFYQWVDFKRLFGRCPGPTVLVRDISRSHSLEGYQS